MLPVRPTQQLRLHNDHCCSPAVGCLTPSIGPIFFEEAAKKGKRWRSSCRAEPFHFARVVWRMRSEKEGRNVGSKKSFSENSSILSGEHLLGEGLKLIIPTHAQQRLKAARLSNRRPINRGVLFRFPSSIHYRVGFNVLQMISFDPVHKLYFRSKNLAIRQRFSSL